MNPLLSIEDLRVDFKTAAGPLRAVDGVSLEVERGETVGLVGESGSGKSSLALAILRLHGGTAGATLGGRVLLEGRDLGRLSDEEMRAVRGARLGMVFQEPLPALDPVFTVGEQVAETLRAHRPLTRSAARARAIELLGQVGLPDPRSAYSTYPHALSGGMRQRALIAAAIACEPALLVADEPTSALDVTVQAEILALLRALQAASGMGLLLITHDLAIVAGEAQRVAVMYSGKIVEEGPVVDVLRAPAHPYTVLLLRSRPSFAARTARLEPIAGAVESALDRPSGCRFRWRCPIAQEQCAAIEPALRPAPGGVSPGHRSACHFIQEASRL